MANTNLVDYFDYPNCIKLENKNTSVVLEHHCGGRVLEYAWQGQNSLYLEPIGPMEKILPGQSVSFTEDWWLLPYKFPEPGQEIDLDKLAQMVVRETFLRRQQ